MPHCPNFAAFASPSIGRSAGIDLVGRAGATPRPGSPGRLSDLRTRVPAVRSEFFVEQNGDPMYRSIRTYRNSLLRGFEPDVIARLQLQPVIFQLHQELEYPGVTVKHLYFIECGMAATTTNFIDGSQVDVGTFGFESVIGMSALMGTRRSLNRVSTQIAGNGYSCLIENARTEFRRGEAFQRATLCYVQSQLIRAAQLAACNARHTVEQRLARWLLICADRTNKVEFTTSHDFLAGMLGSTRPTISLLANKMKTLGFIQYSRGVLSIRNVRGLEQLACECHSVIRQHLRSDTDLDRLSVQGSLGQHPPLVGQSLSL